MTSSTSFLDALVSLVSQGLSQASSLAAPPEIRHLHIAMGKERNNGERAVPLHFPESLALSGTEQAELPMVLSDGSVWKVGDFYPSVKKLPALSLAKLDATTWSYLSVAQNVQFFLHYLNKKSDFITALKDPNAYVLYSGHARYGRGPCFGTTGSAKGEDWEEGSRPVLSATPPPTATAAHPSDTGLFRMAYPYLLVEADEIVDHGYTANLVEATQKLTSADCDPDLRNKVGWGMKKLTLGEIKPDISAQVVDTDPTKKWWVHMKGKKHCVVHHAGWQNTVSNPDDLGATDLKCRVFCHFGCSTMAHNQPVLRKLKGWKKREGGENFAYFTTAPSQMIGGYYFLHHLLAYDKQNAYADIEASLEHARKKANGLLAADGCPFKII